VPTTGAYDFRPALAAVNGVIQDELAIGKGEWAYIDRTLDFADIGRGRVLMIYLNCPDCGHLMTVYRKRGETEAKGHRIDAAGNISPSVLHTWKVDGVEQCGFHTSPTRLLGFVDLR
jgi:hypothetical protein